MRSPTNRKEDRPSRTDPDEARSILQDAILDLVGVFSGMEEYDLLLHWPQTGERYQQWFTYTSLTFVLHDHTKIARWQLDCGPYVLIIRAQRLHALLQVQLSLWSFYTQGLSPAQEFGTRDTLFRVINPADGERIRMKIPPLDPADPETEAEYTLALLATQ